LDLYKKIIDDLDEFDKPLKVLRLYKDGEPLLHLNLPEMVRYAKDKGSALKVDVTTNASMLTSNMGHRLVAAGLDRINISINGISDETYKQNTGYSIDFDKLVYNIRQFYQHREGCFVFIKTIGDLLTKDQQRQFLDIFGDICNQISIEHVAPCWPDFDVKGVNRDVGIYGQTIEAVKVCPYIFYSLAVNSDGTVSLCFLDWSRKMILGDLKTQSLKEIWEGDVLRGHRINHLTGYRGGMCASCGQLSYGLPDNIDAYAETLLERI
jgi:MoaA/NifB/PqqE/SkfB family radical SAM enzyme